MRNRGMQGAARIAIKRRPAPNVSDKGYPSCARPDRPSASGCITLHHLASPRRHSLRVQQHRVGSQLAQLRLGVTVPPSTPLKCAIPPVARTAVNPSACPNPGCGCLAFTTLGKPGCTRWPRVPTAGGPLHNYRRATILYRPPCAAWQHILKRSRRSRSTASPPGPRVAVKVNHGVASQ